MRVLHLGLGLHIKFTSITYELFQNQLPCKYLRFGIHSKVHLNYILGISKRPYMWVFKVGPSFKVLLKSPMGYFEMNLNMVITFRVTVSYNLQYPHTYLFSPTKSLALIFLIIK